MAPPWNDIVRDKQNARAEAIDRVTKLLGAGSVILSEDQNFLRASAKEIVKNIEEGKWTSHAVVSAYIRQAILAHRRTNCLTEILFEQALKEAEEIDAEFASNKRLRGSFHGVPMSVKDCFDVAGYDTSVGYTQWAGSPATRDARLVEHCRSLGAIVIAKTNIPQTMMSFECNNPVFGRTTNPWSEIHTCGGSSGGEAACLSQNGSALGIGSDIGGSLRMPAGYCGIYSFKPGVGRITRAGLRSTTPGYESVNFVTGPLARTSEDVDLMCRALFGLPGADDELLPHLPYIEPKLPEKLRFGYYTSDGIIKASPASQRAVTETITALRNKGHECIEFEPQLAEEALMIYVGLLSADGYKTLLKPVGPDPKDSSLFLPTLGPKLPSTIRWLASFIVKNFVSDEIFANILSVSRTKSVDEVLALNAQRDDLRKRWYEEVWAKYQLDGIICPLQASPAVTHGSTATLSPLALATFLYNLIDSPVGVVPVTRVDPALDALTDTWKQEAGHGSTLLERDLYYAKNVSYDGTEKNSTKEKGTVYDPERMKGLPVAIQVVGKSFEDEKVLAMMRIVDEALGPRGFGPQAWVE